MPYADGVLPPDQRPAVRDALATRPGADAEVRRLPRSPADRWRAPSMTCSRRRSPRGCSRPCAAPAPHQRDRPARATAAPSLLARLADMFRMPAFSPAVAIPAVLVGRAAGWLAHGASPGLRAAGKTWPRGFRAAEGARADAEREHRQYRRRAHVEADAHLRQRADLVPPIRARPGLRASSPGSRVPHAGWHLARARCDRAGTASRATQAGHVRGCRERRHPGGSTRRSQARRRPEARRGGGPHQGRLVEQTEELISGVRIRPGFSRRQSSSIGSSCRSPTPRRRDPHRRRSRQERFLIEAFRLRSENANLALKLYDVERDSRFGRHVGDEARRCHPKRSL